MYSKIKDIFHLVFPTANVFIKRLIASYLTAYTLVCVIFGGGEILSKEFPLGVNIPLLIIAGVTAFFLLGFIFVILDGKYKTDSAWLLIITAFVSVLLAMGKLSFYGAAAVLPFVLLAIYFTLTTDKLRLPSVLKKAWWGVPLFASLVTVFFAGVLVGLRYYNLHTPAYDFGIFAQMFENMKDTLQPITTLERNYELSHFAVHFSPAYYLFLPIYMIFPHPLTLQILQGAVIASGVIPALLIAKKYGLSNMSSAAVGFIFCLLPAFIGGCRYDLHENCLLVPLLMWLFWAIEREKLIPMAVFAALTLTIKEDAAVYVCVVALYVIFDRKKKMKIAGGVMLFSAIIYFICVCLYLDSQGLGVMSWRYDDYIYDGGGLLTVIKSVLINPAYAVSNLVTEDKILFILQMLLPLGFIPLAIRKFSRAVLFVPFILINLMTSYGYQYNINFQYVFGSSAIFIWLFIMNCAELSYHTRRTALVFCSAACLITTMALHYNLTNELINVGNESTSAAIEYLENLDASGESVTADTFLCPALYKQKTLYSINSSGEPDEKKAPDADIVLLDKRYGSFDALYDYYTERGMEEVDVLGAAGDIICRLER